MNVRRQTLLIALGLVLLTAAVFQQVTGFNFLSFDDARYIPDNPMVSNGLSFNGILWAFSTRHHGYWHPITWIVHMLNCQFFGLNAGAHHTMNLLFHIVNVLLLFGLLIRLTGRTGRSAFVTALFAIHPMHVESVAWIAELKDVLSTMFWLWTVWVYAIYIQNKARKFYWLAIVLYAVGLMAKPMIVTLPLILLLLDFWPLNRLSSENWRSRVVEKAPFFVLAGISAIVTFLTTAYGGVVGSVAQYPITARVSNVITAYGMYLSKFAWPHHLACLYPYDMNLSTGKIFASVLIILLITGLAMATAKRHPYVLTGWFWFLVMLLPVIGIIQAGPQSMADRYSYLSYVGLFIMITWSVSDWANQSLRLGRVLPVLGIVIILALAVRARSQVQTWKDSLTLFRHAAEVTTDNYMAYNNLGILLADEGQLDEAIVQYRQALSLCPQFAYTQNNLGNALIQKNELDEAITHFNEALRLNPNYAEARNNLGIALAKQGRWDEAIHCFLAALKANPDNEGRQGNLLRAIDKIHDQGKAAAYYRATLEIANSANRPNLRDTVKEKLDRLTKHTL